jgi:hypothetical protein
MPLPRGNDGGRRMDVCGCGIRGRREPESPDSLRNTKLPHNLGGKGAVAATFGRGPAANRSLSKHTATAASDNAEVHAADLQQPACEDP